MYMYICVYVYIRSWMQTRSTVAFEQPLHNSRAHQPKRPHGDPPAVTTPQSTSKAGGGRAPVLVLPLPPSPLVRLHVEHAELGKEDGYSIDFQPVL